MATDVPPRDRWRWLEAALLLALVLVLAWLAGPLDARPHAWWDEGWTMTVARTWVEQGHYGVLSEGQPAPPTLAASFPTVAAVALAFRLFGVGIAQGRGAIYSFTLLGLVLLYLLTRRLYGRGSAVAALGALLLTTGHFDLQPLYFGRFVLAEFPMFCFLLLGYLCLGAALRGRAAWAGVAALAWGLALVTKAQPLPFWLLSLLAPLGLVLRGRERREALLLGGTLVLSLLARVGWGLLFDSLLAGHTLAEEPLPGLYGITTLVLDPDLRGEAWRVLRTSGLPILLGLAWAGWRLRYPVTEDRAERPTQLLRLACLTFTASWLVWYALLAAPWMRYIVPAVFMGHIFVGYAVHQVWEGARAARAGLGWRGVLGQPLVSLAGLLVILVLLRGVSPSLGVLRFLFGTERPQAMNGDLYAAADFLNAQPPGTLLETFDSELFVRLNQPYHFPPPAIQVPATRRYEYGEDVPFEYDALAADPDFLVIGTFSGKWHIYDAALASGAFQPVQQFGEYAIFQRVRIAAP